MPQFWNCDCLLGA